MKIIFSFTNNILLTVHLFYLFNCISISIISYFVFINLKINNIISLFSSSTYSLLPYVILRNVSHLLLSMYQFIPLGILLCIWIYLDDNIFKIYKNFFLIKKYYCFQYRCLYRNP